MDDDDYQCEARNKVELDIERNVLGLTCILSDHSEEFIFRRSDRRNEAGVFVYECKLCGVPNLHGERCLQTHIVGKKHQTKYAQPVIDVSVFRAKQEARPKPQITMKIAPGEPVPPGFEDEVKPISVLQKTIDACKNQALVALEYIVELTNEGGKEPGYHCTLCNKRGDPRTIMFHLTSFMHRQKFLEKHFPNIIKEMQIYRNIFNQRDIFTRIMQVVCESIEDSLGRLAPSVVSNTSYNKTAVMMSINAEKHLDEKSGSSFIDAIDHSAIKACINGKNPNYGISGRKRDAADPPKNISPPKEVKNSEKEPEKKVSVPNRKERNSLDSISSLSDSSVGKMNIPVTATIDLRSDASMSPISDMEKSREKPKEEIRQICPTPRELAHQSNEITKQKYQWEKYRCLMETAVAELEKKFKEYEKIPEKHPLYPEEWKQFWNRRYKELQAEKKDPAKHDFKPEWIVFWTKRMQELHEADIEKKKSEIRRRLQLPKEGSERDAKEQYALKINLKTTTLDNRDRDRDRRVHDSKRGDSSRRQTKKRSRSRSRSRSPRRRSPQRRRVASPPRRRGSRSPSSRRPTSRVIHRERSLVRKQLDPFSDDDSNDSRRRNGRSRSPHRSAPSSVHKFPPNTVPPVDYYNAPRPRQVDEWGRPIYYPAPLMPSNYYYPEKEKEPKLLEEEETELVTVVSVLRLLTALEDLLGSLGPKVNDLLAKALALEKIKANSSDDMLINEDTCVIFETIKEKLKGQLIADVVEKHKVAAVKRAVKNVAIIIHQVTEQAKKAGKVAPPEEPKASTSAIAPASQIANIKDSEKATIAIKIAAALKMQGKTDVTPEQLEELIGVYMAMQQKAKETNEIITTAEYMSTSASSAPTKASAPTPIVEPAPAPVETKAVVAKEETNENSSDILASLTDSDLETLLQNFQDLSPEEQQHLIAYLKKLELSQPLRVERLRKFVNVDQNKNDSDDEDSAEQKPMTEKIMYPSKSIIERSTTREAVVHNVIESDDDDDYSYEDVFQAASKNVKEKQLEDHMKVVHSSLQRQERDDEYSNASRTSSHTGDGSLGGKSGLTLADTQNMIDNLMGSLHKNVRQNKMSGNHDSQSSHGSQQRRLRQEQVDNDEMDIEPREPAQQVGKIPFYLQQQQNQQSSYYQQQSSSNSNVGHVSYPMQQNAQNSYNQNANSVQYPIGFGRNSQGFGGNTQGFGGNTQGFGGNTPQGFSGGFQNQQHGGFHQQHQRMQSFDDSQPQQQQQRSMQYPGRQGTQQQNSNQRGQQQQQRFNQFNNNQNLY